MYYGNNGPERGQSFENHYGHGCFGGHRRFGHGFHRHPFGQYAAGAVPVNVRETAEQYELHVLAPARRKEEFTLTVDDNVLSIAWKPAQTEGENWARQEFQTQAFERKFQLNDRIDADRIEARYADGVLVVTLPKAAGAQQPGRDIGVA